MNYTPIRLSTLKAGIPIPFNLFIFFKEQYLEYSEKGTSFEKSKFRKLRRQKFAKFFISDTDEKAYQKFLDDILNDTLSDANAPLEDKIELVKGVASTGIERLKKDPGSETSYQITQNAAKKLRELIFNNPDALKSIFGKDDESDVLIKHSLNVCALSIKFAEKLKLKESEIDNIATAALMHDIGIAQLSEEDQKLFNKPKKDFSGPEKLAYWEHCNNILPVLKEKPYVNKTVIDLIENHEETKSGSGPKKKMKLSQMEEMLSLVNSYDKKILTEGIPPSEALKNMMIDDLGNYELTTLKKFQEVVKAEGL